MFINNLSIRRSFIFSFEAALCNVLAYALHDIQLRSADGSSTKFSFGMAMIQLFFCACLALINLLPALVIRGAILRRPESGGVAITASFCCYASIYFIGVLPYNVITGEFRIFSLWNALSLVAKLVWAFLSYAANYHIITMPTLCRDSMGELYIPLTESDKCMTFLGDYMALLYSQIGERRQMEKLWNPVYSYLKDTERIRNLVQSNRLSHDQIVLNAVGSIAYKLLSGGDLHSGPGTLSPDGEYARKVWWVTANELVRRSYNQPEDVSQGLAALDAAIVSAGFAK